MKNVLWQLIIKKNEGSIKKYEKKMYRDVVSLIYIITFINIFLLNKWNMYFNVTKIIDWKKRKL